MIRDIDHIELIMRDLDAYVGIRYECCVGVKDT